MAGEVTGIRERDWARIWGNRAAGTDECREGALRLMWKIDPGAMAREVQGHQLPVVFSRRLHVDSA